MRVAVLGLGSIGRRHAGNLLSLGHEVVGFDPCPAAGAESWSRAESAEAALAQATAAVVATPSSRHGDDAAAALDHGRHVLIEKPMTVDPEQASRLAARAQAMDITCGVAMNLRFHPAIGTLQTLLADGTLGPIRYAQVSAGSDLRTWRTGSDYRTSYSAQAQLGGGVVRDTIHELDYVTWLLGSAVTVVGEVARVSDLEIDVEDVGTALLRLASGAVVSVDLTYVDRVYRRGCLLVGAEATARWDWTQGTIEISRPEAEPQVLDVRADVADTYVRLMEDFIAACERGGVPRTSAQEGSAMVHLADAILRSAATGSRITL
jgi:predicted dehydrogenase